jgi:hypothetical protein
VNYLAIDPGANGGIAYTDGETVSAIRMPAESELVSYLRGVAMHQPVTAVIEDLPMGMAGAFASSMAKLHGQAGLIRGLLIAFGVRVVLVRPQVWQARYGLGTRKAASSPTKWKRKLANEAARRFPGVDVTLLNADALLILEWATATRA